VTELPQSDSTFADHALAQSEPRFSDQVMRKIKEG
jgi:hypothetical protein